MKQKPNVQFDARMLAAHTTGTMTAFRLRNNLTMPEVTARAKWLTKQSEEYRRQVKACLEELLARLSQ